MIINLRINGKARLLPNPNSDRQSSSQPRQPTAISNAQQQQNNLSMFFKQVMHKLFMIADVNGDEQVDREIEYILVAFDELEGMDPDDISRISMTRLNDPE